MKVVSLSEMDFILRILILISTALILPAILIQSLPWFFKASSFLTLVVMVLFGALLVIFLYNRRTWEQDKTERALSYFVLGIFIVTSYIFSQSVFGLTDFLQYAIVVATLLLGYVAYATIRESNETSRKASRPVVVVMFRRDVPSDASGSDIEVIARNIGGSLARGIGIAFWPPLPSSDRIDCRRKGPWFEIPEIPQGEQVTIFRIRAKEAEGTDRSVRQYALAKYSDLNGNPYDDDEWMEVGTQALANTRTVDME